MRIIDNFILYPIDDYIDVGIVAGNDDNIFGIMKEGRDIKNDYILRIWGCAFRDWLDKYGIECRALSIGNFYGVIVKGVDEV